MLETTEAGNGTIISYSADGKGSTKTDKTALAIFGLDSKTQASMTLNKPVQPSASYADKKTFEFSMNTGAGPDTYKLEIEAWGSWPDLQQKLNDALQAGSAVCRMWRLLSMGTATSP